MVTPDLPAEPNPDVFWSRVRARLAATGTRLSAEEILAARDADRKPAGAPSPASEPISPA